MILPLFRTFVCFFLKNSLFFSLQHGFSHLISKLVKTINEKFLMRSPEEKVRIAILLPKELFDKLEEHSKKSFLGRSSWVIQAISEKIFKEEKKQE